jgi:creatinine amidohydrolase
MRLRIAALFLTLALPPVVSQVRPPQPTDKGQRLEDVTWPEAERLLTPETVVVIPLGAASSEHGPHLKLRNDLTLADYLTNRVLDAASVVVAPTLTYHHYPAFLEYPGSTSLSLDSARDLTADVVRTLAASGPRRFYVLNTGLSTVRALEPAASALAGDGILMRFTNLSARLNSAARGLREQEGGSHADEIETSMMLYIDPSTVDMTKAVKDFGPESNIPRFTRQRGGRGNYSPTGVWGDPTLANRDKGRVIVEGLVSGILDDIGQLRSAPLPARSTASSDAATPRSDPAVPPPPTARPETCTPGDERTIRNIGTTFTTYWANKDAEKLAGLWAPSGNIIHPDGVIEHGPDTIRLNRARLFSLREYRFSRHPMVINLVRCVSADVAVADGKWELRGVADQSGKPQPIMEGQVTLVVNRASAWSIEAYRYTIKPPPQSQTTPQTRPGLPDVIIK